MKSLIKNSAPLFILILLGYTQVFAHIHRVDFSTLTPARRSHHIQAPVDQTTEISGDYFTEESKRNLLKPYTRNDSGSDIFYAHVSAEYFLQRLEIVSSFGERSERLSIFRASLFRVLRL